MGATFCNFTKIDGSYPMDTPTYSNLNNNENNSSENSEKIEKSKSRNYDHNPNHIAIFKRVQSKWKRKMAKKHYAQTIPILDGSLMEYGKFISVEEMESKVSQEVLKLSSTLSLINVDSVNSQSEGEFLICRKPFQYNTDNSVYRGFWNKKGKREGYGVEVNEDGSMKEGTWRDGFLVFGRIFQNDGIYYEGELLNNNPHGKGKKVNGAKVFSGNWENGFQLNGKIIFEDGYSYEGTYEKNMLHGKGIFNWPDGSTFEGNFSESSISGHGIYKTIDGDIYNGEWLNNLPHGEGEYIYAGKKGETQKYVGSYLFGKKDGKGIFYGQDNIEYNGEWKNGVPHGRGAFKYKENLFEGIFRFGRLVFQDPSPKKADLNLKFSKEKVKEKDDLKYLLPENNKKKNLRTYMPSMEIFKKAFGKMLISNS
jgi:hypothetical protein